MGGIEIRPKVSSDLEEIECFLKDHDALQCARAGELVDALQYPALIAVGSGRIMGALTYIPGGSTWEVLTLHAEEPKRGIGSALMKALEGEARAGGCTRLFLTTTNDNLDALRFYQRRGFEFVEVRRGAVDESRKGLKPSIPRVGDNGIPLRDEILLERWL